MNLNKLFFKSVKYFAFVIPIILICSFAIWFAFHIANAAENPWIFSNKSESSSTDDNNARLGGKPINAITATAGAFTVTEYGPTGLYEFNDPVLKIKNGANLEIKNTDPNAPTDDKIEIEDGANVQIILAGVNINSNCAFRIFDNSKGNVNITLKDNSTNTLQSGDVRYAGLQKNSDENSGTLTIQAETDAGKKGNGILKVKGGLFSAGIGGGQDAACSHITINGGTVAATGEWGAGIGGGENGTGSYITINGGTVAATGGWGTGIGGGNRAAGSYITINGGTVTANGESDAAGIGGGDGALGYNITISGGTVTANSGDGAGIGGGRDGVAYDIYISGGSVKASSIGCQPKDEPGDDGKEVFPMTIANPNYTDVYIGDSEQAYIPCNHATADPSNPDTNLYVYHPDTSQHVLNVKVGQSVIKYLFFENRWNALLNIGGLDIGSVDGSEIYIGQDYIIVDTTYKILSNKPMWIKNKDISQVTNYGIEIYKNIEANITLSGVNIDCDCAFKIADNSTGNVTITLSNGTYNILKSSEFYAGIQKNGNSVGTLTIKSETFKPEEMGRLDVSGGDYAAGIGGGYSGSTSNITISGGTVTANGGRYGAGIGGGGGAAGSYITINGGTVTANGGDSAAGIGCGYVYSVGAHDIYISGGSVKASSIGCQPKDKPEAEGGKDVYLMTIDNPDSADVYIGDIEQPYEPCNHSAADPSNPDTHLYTYQPGINGDLLDVKVGNDCAVYQLDTASNIWKFLESSGTLNINGYQVREGTDYIYENNKYTIKSSKQMTISNKDIVVATLDCIEIAENISANITLAGVNIDVSGTEDACAFKIADSSEGEVTITLKDESTNILKSGQNCAGLQKSGDADSGTLIIQAETGQGNSRDGVLIATGGSRAAGIGGGYSGSGSNITISGGSVAATGGGAAAGIGGGDGAAGSYIEITGGNVVASSSADLSDTGGSGIGGGVNGAGSNIAISGGIVNAAGGPYSAAIGGGCFANGYSIKISRGIVNATGEIGGAGIGGGHTCVGYDITISGGTVTATSDGNLGFGIGSGSMAEETHDIYISGGSVQASSIGCQPKDKPEVEGGKDVYLMTIDNPDFADVYIGDIEQPYEPCNHSAADPSNPDTHLYTYQADTGDDKGHYLDVRVGDEAILYKFDSDNKKWDVIVCPGALDISGFGVRQGEDYTYNEGLYTIVSEKPMTIKNKDASSLTSDHVEISADIKADITLAGVNIDVSGTADLCAFKIAESNTGNVTITLKDSSTNILKSGENCAGLQKNGDSLGALIIKAETDDKKPSNGILQATGGKDGAGIGGGHNGSASNITISGGTVTANGGNNGAGIGGGSYSFGSGIAIFDGTVIATGGIYSAGIGGGQRGEGYNITISGGTVTATGGEYAAGIGGGSGKTGYNITISGGTVTAAGRNADDIGRGGNAPLPYDIFINGGSVKASKISCQPKDKKDGNDVALLKLPNENYNKIKFDNMDSFYEPRNHAAADPANPDTFLYTYQPAIENKELSVGYINNNNQLEFLQIYKYYNNTFNLVDTKRSILDLKQQIESVTRPTPIQLDVDYVSEYVGFADESLIIEIKDKNINLDLCGHTIDIGNNAFHVFPHRTFSVTDSLWSTTPKNGFITGHKVKDSINNNVNEDFSANTAIFYNEGMLDLKNITIGGTYDLPSVSQISAIYNKTEMSVSIDNCVFKFNESLYDPSQSLNDEPDIYGGSCIYNDESCTAMMNNTKISYCNTHNGYGGAICNFGKVILVDVDIKQCSALHGAAVYNGESANLIFNNSSITNCRATNAGGGLFISNGSGINLEGDSNYINSNTGFNSVKDNIYLDSSPENAIPLIYFYTNFGNSGTGSIGVRVAQPEDKMPISVANDKIAQWKSAFVYDNDDYTIDVNDANQLILDAMPVVEYNISKGQSDHVEDFSLPTKAAESYKVVLPTVTTKESYSFKAWHVTDSLGKDVQVLQDAENNWYFNMPASDVTVVAEVNGYKASSITVEGSHVSSPSGVVQAGQYASYEISFDRGFSLDGYIIVYNKTKAEETSIPVLLMGNNFFFLMPMFDAEVQFSVKVDFHYIDCYLNDGVTELPYDTQELNPEQISVKPSDPTREGYTFKGWYTNPDCSGDEFIFGTTIDQNYNLYAKWELNTHKVVFNANGHGTNPSEIPDQAYGTLIENPGTITDVKGFTHDGNWYTEQACTNKWDFENNTMPDNDLMLYAKWTINYYSVKYEENGGNEWPDLQNITWDQDGLLPPEGSVAQEGYTFGGWYSDDIFTPENKVETTTKYGDIALVDKPYVTLYAKWEEKTFTVNYDTNGGTEIDPAYDIGWTSVIPIPSPAPKKQGYELEGWYADAGFTKAITEETTYGDVALVDSVPSIVVYAKWNELSIFTLYYNSTGGIPSIDPKTEVGWTQKNLLPDTDPTWEGHTFAGWYNDNRLVSNDTAFCDLTHDEQGDATLYAEWTDKDGYVVLYDTDGGTYVQEITVKYNEAGLLPDENPEKSGYTFNGWYSDIDRTIPVDEETTYAYIAKSDTVKCIYLYAKWIPKKYKVSFDMQEHGEEILPIEVDYGSTIEEPEKPSADGWSFNGWYTEAECIYRFKFEKTKVTDNLTLYAKWIANSYTVNYVTNGGSPWASKTDVKWNDAYLLPPDNVITKMGFKLVAWYSDEGLQKEVKDTTPYSEIAGASSVTSITLYAKWQEKTFTVNYYTNGGTEVEPVENVGWTSVIPIPTHAPTKQGYELEGWYADAGFTKAITEDTTYGEIALIDTVAYITIYAKWQEKSNFTVNYDLNGGTSDPIPSITVSWTQKSLLPDTDPTWDGHTFAGWYDDNRLVSKDTAFCDLTHDEKGNATLYACWTDNDGYIVLYDTDGGTYIEGKTVKYNDAGLLPDENPEKNGYTFDGWFSNTERTVPVNNDTTYAEIAGSESVRYIYLYAKWLPNKVTVSFDKQGHGQDIPSITVDYGFAITAPEPPEADGWTFGGWYKDSECKYLYDFTTPVTSNFTLYAKWNQKLYSVKYQTKGGNPWPDMVNVTWEQTDLLPKYGYVVKVGFTLEGWYSSEEFTEENKVEQTTQYSQIAGEDSVTSITLYAKWEEKTFTVNYDTNGGTEVGSVENVGWTIVIPIPSPAPIKQGYEFGGWYADTGFTKAIKSTTTYGEIALVDSKPSIVVYAKWNEVSTFTLYYDTMGGSPSINPKTNIAWTQKNLLPDIDPTWEGHTFAGWYDGSRLVSNDTAFCDLTHDEQGNATLYAGWTDEDGYIVLYDTDGGTYIEGITVKYKDAGLLPSKNPEKFGYTFEGWYSNTERTNIVDNNTTYEQIAGSTEVKYIYIYAKWMPNKVTVSFDMQEHGQKIDPLIVDYGSTIKKPKDPTADGWSFEGWYTEPDCIYSFNFDKTKVTGDLILYAKWIANSYTVNYETNGGSAWPSKTDVKWDDNNLLPKYNVITKMGFKLVAWYSDKELQNEVKNTTPYSEIAGAPSVTSITLYAKWQEKTFTVNYDANEGTEVDPAENIGWTKTIPIPSPAPTKQGYELEGWYADAGFTKAIKSTTTYGEIALIDTVKFITIYAKWQEKSNFTVNYDINGGTSGPIAPKIVSWTQKNLLPYIDPTWEGHTFTGWYDGNRPVSKDTAFCDLTHDAQGNATLYAGWTDKEGYIVLYDTDGGTHIEEITVKYNDAGLLPDIQPEKSGYTFNGWFSDIDRTIPVYEKTTYADIAKLDTVKYIYLYAKWIENSNYTVKYDTDDGTSIPDKENVKWSEANLLPSQDPIKEGYIFQGWYSDTSFTKIVTSATTYAELVAGSSEIRYATIYAKWKVRIFSLHYESDGGTKYPVKSNVMWNDSKLLPANEPLKEGYTFIGWFDGVDDTSQKIDNSTKYCDLAEAFEDVDYAYIYARWLENSDYVVKYDCGEYGPQLEPKTNVRWMEYNLCPDKDPELEGHTFVGWFKDADFINPVKDATRYKNLAESDLQKFVTIFAKWSVNSYVVTFDLQGHGKDIKSQTLEYGSKIKKPADPVEENYTFNGWFKDQNCTFAWDFDNDTIKSDTILFASWTYNDIPIPVPVPPAPTPGSMDIVQTGDTLNILFELFIVLVLSAGFALRCSQQYNNIYA